MNLILFTPEETVRPLPRTDPRARHLLDVLQRRVGDTFDAGLRHGPRGKGTLAAIAAAHLELTFTWGDPPPRPDPVTLVIGLPRPQTARKILREATAIGVAAMHFVATDRGDPAYARSTLWTDGEWERHLVAGAEQAFCTHLPIVTHGQALAEVIATLPMAAKRLACDNYEAPASLSQAAPPAGTPCVLAFGAERGWSAGERTLLRECDFTFVHLGNRVLRVETAVIAALAVLKARQGTM
ncbi:MAG: 16S rRNA (uracil(1498)-N(3))-methyltransferase [Opitutaceae bacterium]|nr:16S rRNA (uracil(1498)-N(3))-methyltransferase [Opitutaceae bacterium]